MILLSNLIKSSHVMTLDEMRKLRLINQYFPNDANAELDQVDSDDHEEQLPDEETISLRDQIISDATITAQQRIKETAEECEKMLADAEAQIDVWWLEKRNEDEAIREENMQSGYEAGFQSGYAAAELEVKAQWEANLTEASQLLKEAYRTREQIIQEAEPFIVELSCSIAEKIVGKQLSLEPSMIIDLISKSLSRRREQGEITLCVAPSSLAFVQAAREELNATIDSQAELVILPDSTVKDNGCVIRSKYGSIDARIDTQLSEIKRELLLIAHQSVEERGQGND